MAEINQTDERDKNSRRERENPRVHTRMGIYIIPRHKKRQRSTRQSTRINAHANMEIHYNRNTSSTTLGRHSADLPIVGPPRGLLARAS